MTHFNEVANEWDSPGKIKLMKALATKAIDSLKLSEKINILDFGCGTGLFGLEFLDYTKNLVGVDVSEGMLNVFDKKASELVQVNSYCGELKHFKTDLKFDLIVSSMAFHHLDSPAETLGELKQLIASNGSLAIVDLAKEDGSFHPDNVKMGVKHFGFSEVELTKWAKQNHLQITIETLNEIKKNDKSYSQFLAIFTE